MPLLTWGRRAEGRGRRVPTALDACASCEGAPRDTRHSAQHVAGARRVGVGACSGGGRSRSKHTAAPAAHDSRGSRRAQWRRPRSSQRGGPATVSWEPLHRPRARSGCPPLRGRTCCLPTAAGVPRTARRTPHRVQMRTGWRLSPAAWQVRQSVQRHGRARACAHARCAPRARACVRACVMCLWASSRHAHLRTSARPHARCCARHVSPLADFAVAWQGRRLTWRSSRSTP